MVAAKEIEKSVSQTFLNHASFIYEYGSVRILFDPWFFGSVFNDSWTLMHDTDDYLSALDGITHICITHEHPDHFNIPTLKAIYEDKRERPPTLIFPERVNPVVAGALSLLGFPVVYADRRGVEIELSEHVRVAYFGENSGHDNSIIIVGPDCITLNQNDHYPSIKTSREIRARYPVVNFMWTQFSLAGFYGNKRDPNQIIQAGTRFHVERVIKYAKEFNVEWVIPFASFVYFSHQYNAYLNSFAVSLKDIKDALTVNNISYQLLYYGDGLLNSPSSIKLRNDMNLEKMAKLFESKNIVIKPSVGVGVDETVNAIENKLSKIPRIILIRALIHNFRNLGFYKDFARAYVTVLLIDLNIRLKINLLKGCVSFACSDASIDLEAPSDQFLYMFNYAWGADTFNIAATHEYITAHGRLLQIYIAFSNTKHYR